MNTRQLVLGLLIAATVALSGCGGGSSSATNTSGVAVTGTVTKGPVNGASVTIYALNSDGSRGAIVAGPFSTDGDGTWNGTIPSTFTPPFEVVATGGSYLDEASNVTVQIGGGAELNGVIAAFPGSGPVLAPVTPYTNALALSARRMAADGLGIGTAVARAIANAQSSLGFDPTNVLPPDPLNPGSGASAIQLQYAALLGGISQLVQNAAINGANPFDVAIALSRDMEDGRLDGLDAQGNQISVSDGGSGSVNLPTLGAGSLAALINAANTFTGSRGNTYAGVTLPGLNGGFYNPPDTVAPEVTAPADISVNATVGATSVPAVNAEIAAFLVGASATDNVDGNITAISNDAPSEFPIGDTTVTFSATDAYGNTGSATATVTVVATQAPDTTAPVVTAPNDITVTAAQGETSVSAGNGTITAFLAGASATDDVDGTINDISNDAPGSFPIGTTTVTFSATDAASNTGTATATVTVQAAAPPVDNTAPVVTPPNDITVSAAQGESSVSAGDSAIVAFLAGASATDDVDGTITNISNNAPGSFPIGTTTVTFSATDAASNTGTASATVTVQAAASGDTVAPVVTAPADVTVYTNPSATTISYSDSQLTPFRYGASAIDDVDGAIGTVTNDLPTTLSLGDTVVTFSATDNAGNTGTASATVTVLEGISPPSYTLQQRNPTPTSQNLNKVVYNGQEFVAVGDKGTIISSSDGVTWTDHTLTGPVSSDYINDIAWGNGLFVGVTFYGKAVVSSDGSTWNSYVTGAPRYLFAVAYGNGIFVAAGSKGSQTGSESGILTSADGENWTLRASGTTKSIADVIWTGTQFLAVGGNDGTSDPSPLLLSSPDGITWTPQALPVDSGDLSALTVHDNTVVAVGTNGYSVPLILTSTDGGSNWTDQSSNGLRYGMKDVTWVGNQFVAVGPADYSYWNNVSNLGENVLTSPDGLTWTRHNPKPSGGGATFSGIATDTGTTIMVAVGPNGALYTSADADNWTNRQSNLFSAGESSLRAAHWSGDQFIVVGESATAGNTPPMVATSVDGAAWTERSVPLANGTLTAITGNGSVLVAVGVQYGSSAGAVVLTSTDGVTWTEQNAGVTQQLNRVIWSSRLNSFVAVGAGGTILTSGDGSTWTAQTSGTSDRLMGIADNGATLVAVGGEYPGSVVLTSDDGTTWTTRNSACTTSVEGVAWNGSRFMAACDNSQLMTSSDGISWSRVDVYVGNHWYTDMIWTGSAFIAPALDAILPTTVDGVHWASFNTPGFQLFGAAEDPNSGTVVVVGNAGSIGLILSTQ